IRLGDGTRLVSRFNTTHTVQDLYDFVSAAMPANETRRWVIMTTFPSKELKDKSIALGELEGYKRGGVVVQKWVLSGKGGVGKSSVTLQLALSLSLQGRSVGILDVDLTGPSIPRLVGLENAKITQAPGGWIPVTVHPAALDAATSTTQTQATETTSAVTSTTEQTTTEVTTTETSSKNRGSLRCMSLGFLLRDRGDAVIWRGPKKTAMIRQFLADVLWGETDYLLIDTPPGTGDEHIALAEQLLTLSQEGNATGTRVAGAVVVTTPQAISTADVRKELNFCTKTRIPVIGVIENMSGYTCPCCGEVSNVFSRGGGEVMAQDMGVRFLGRVPIDVTFSEMIEGPMAAGEEKAKEHEQEKKKLLVERYGQCWSMSLFDGFAKSVIQVAEQR
ncbi:cytosolic Fe-S cluster assembly factor cfd1, partial [Ascosphaera atra]